MPDPMIPGGGGGRLGAHPSEQRYDEYSPMDMNTNRYEKPVQTPSRGAEGASPDCVASEQCQSAYRQNMKTAAEVYWNLADKAEPSRYQETAVAAEGAGTDGTTNVRDRSINCNKRKTTVRKFPTNCVVFVEPTSGRVSPVVAEMQYQWDDQKSIKTTEVRLPRDYLEIPEPRLPQVFLDLAEEARNVKVESGRSDYTKDDQLQETGLDRPVFVTIMVDSPLVPKKGALRATGVSTEMIPNRSSAGRGEPGDRSGLVCPQNKTEQPVLLGSDVNQSGTAPVGPVGPDVLMDRIQPVGQNSTRRPVGTEGMFSASNSDRMMADGPVGRFVTHGPVGPDRILSTRDPDRPVADSPVGRFLKFGPVGPRRIFSLDEINQPVAVGPVGHPFTLGPVGTHARVSQVKRMNQRDDSPVGSTGILGPVNQTGSHIRSDFVKISTINGPASSGGTPPSSDSGVHSLGEQWENMSTNSIDMESEQNKRPTYDSTMSRRVSDTGVPPNAEEGGDIDYPWVDRLLERESDERSSVEIQQSDRNVQFNNVTVYVSDTSMVHSGTDGRNSDIGALSDFSDSDEETGVEQPSGCRIPGCQCEGHIPFMEWGSEDMTETDDSKYEGSIDRANRLYVESYNYDLSEGMTPMTYTPPPLRRNRRRRYEVRKEKEVDIDEPIPADSDRVIHTENESPKLERTVQTETVVYDDIPKLGDKPVDPDRGPQTGSDGNNSSKEDSTLWDGPVTESTTEGDGQDFPDPNNTEYWANINRQARQAMWEMTGNDATLSDDKYPDIVKNIARMTMRAWAEHDALPVEQQTGCEMPGCQCNGRVEFMIRGSEDMTETDDSEYEDTVDRDSRSCVENRDYDLS